MSNASDRRADKGLPTPVQGSLSTTCAHSRVLYELSLKARNRSPKTIRSYMETVELFTDFLLRSGMPSEVDKINREHIEAFVADQLERWRPMTAHVRYGNLASFSTSCAKRARSLRTRWRT